MAVLLLLPCPLWGCADPEACRLEQVADIPLLRLPGDARVEVPIEVDRRPARLLLDTGADTTVLTDAAFNRLAGLERDDHQLPISGIHGVQLAGRTDLWRFSLGPLSSELSIAVLDHSILPPIPPTDGLLGLNALAGYDLDLDLAGGRFGIYRPHGNCSRPTTAMTGAIRTVPLLASTSDMPKPRFRVTIAGIPLVAELDTGAAKTVLFAGIARRLGYLAPGRRTSPLFGIGGVTNASNIVLSRIRLGPFNLHDMPAAVLDEPPIDRVDLLLGMDFAHYVHAWISNSSGTLIMQYPPLATAAGSAIPPTAATNGEPSFPAAASDPPQTE